MARPFTIDDAKRITQEHEELTQKLNTAQTLQDDYKKQIADAAARITARNTLNILRDIPVEETDR